LVQLAQLPTTDWMIVHHKHLYNVTGIIAVELAKMWLNLLFSNITEKYLHENFTRLVQATAETQQTAEYTIID